MATTGDPASHGDAFLEFAHGSAREHEAARWRDAALARPTRDLMRRGPLMRLAVVIAALRIVVLAAFVGLFIAWALFAEGIAALVMPVAIFGIAVVGLVLFGAARQFLFSCGLVWALQNMNNQSPEAAAVVKETLRSRRRLARLGLGRMAAPVRSLYEAATVFAIPAMLAEGLDYRAARERSEELVALRWGPGRFRAHAMPRMALTNVRYVELIEQHGPSGPWRQVWFVPAAVVVGVAGGLVLGMEFALPIGMGVIVVWALVLGVQSTTSQPVMEGVLRAYLYDYARSGRALPPYEAGLLHDCMREELRGILGLPQRAPGDAPVAADASMTPTGYVRDAGVSSEHVANALGALPDLMRDNRTVMRAVRDILGEGGRADGSTVIARAGLVPERTQVILANLVQTKNLLASNSLDGTTTYAPRKKKAAIWEKK